MVPNDQKVFTVYHYVRQYKEMWYRTVDSERDVRLKSYFATHLNDAKDVAGNVSASAMMSVDFTSGRWAPRVTFAVSTGMRQSED